MRNPKPRLLSATLRRISTPLPALATSTPAEVVSGLALPVCATTTASSTSRNAAVLRIKSPKRCVRPATESPAYSMRRFFTVSCCARKPISTPTQSPGAGTACAEVSRGAFALLVPRERSVALRAPALSPIKRPPP